MVSVSVYRGWLSCGGVLAVAVWWPVSQILVTPSARFTGVVLVASELVPLVRAFQNAAACAGPTVSWAWPVAGLADVTMASGSAAASLTSCLAVVPGRNCTVTGIGLALPIPCASW